MSHTVTIRTATVTTGTSNVFFNSGYLRSYRGILKVLELVLGIVCVGIIGHNIDSTAYYNIHKQFFFLIATTFMIGTFILVLSCLASISTDSIISKTIYEVIYHAIAFGLLLAASLTLLITVNNNKRYYSDYELLLGASWGKPYPTLKTDAQNALNLAATASGSGDVFNQICGLVNTALYFISTILALRSYRGL